MSRDGSDPGPGRAVDGARPGLPDTDDEDDLDLAFGPGTSSAPVRTPRQRIGRGAVIGIGVVVTAGVIAAVLFTIIGGIQNGVGGVFPRPDAAQSRFGDAALDLDGVRRVTTTDPSKTSFASYDVVSTVTVEPTLSDAERSAVVGGLTDAAKASSGNGVQVYAIADLGTVQVGVSGDGRATTRRLELARQVDAIGGVRSVRVAWGSGEPSDEPGSQVVLLESPGRGAALGAIVAKATQQAQVVFPGATVRAAAAKP